MRKALVYFVLQSLHWFIVCSIAWSIGLGASVPAWKMVALAVFAGFVCTALVPIQGWLGGYHKEPAGKGGA